MSDLWFFGHADPWARNGFQGPDPPLADSSWSWDVEFETGLRYSTYARASLNTFAEFGNDSAWITSGIISYRTRDAQGVDTLHPVGQSDPNGLVDFIHDMGVDDVTFGWTLGADNSCQGKINMEIWVTWMGLENELPIFSRPAAR